MSDEYGCVYCGRTKTEADAQLRGCCGEHIGHMLDLSDPKQAVDWVALEASE